METAIAAALGVLIGVLIVFGVILLGMTAFLTADWRRSGH